MRYLRVEYVAEPTVITSDPLKERDQKRFYNALGSMDDPAHVVDYIDIGRILCQRKSDDLVQFCETLRLGRNATQPR